MPLIVAGVLASGGYLVAHELATEPATVTTQRVVTFVRKTPANTPQLDVVASRRPPEVVTIVQTTTEPGETGVVTVRRAGRAVVVRAPGETVAETLTVRGPVRQRVVTNARTDTVVRTETRDRPTTVTTPGTTQTVTRETTQTVTREKTVTEEEEVTVTETVTVTVKKGPPDTTSP
jgi:hypothetical protein